MIASAIAFGIATWLTPGVSEATDPSVLAAVLLLGIIDVALRPLLMAVALPIGLIAVGILGLLFRVVVFAIVLPLAGYQVDGFVSTVLASFIYGAVLTALSGLIGMSDEDSFSARVVAQVIRDDESPTHTDVPGVLMIQIDGLAAPLLRAQVRAGNLPTLSRWIRDGSHRLAGWTALLPSQTSASQAGLLLGSNDGIPAFRWYEKEHRRLLVSNHAADAREIESRLSTGNGLLAGGGASIDNLFSGDASISRLTMSKVGNNEDQAGATRSLYYFLLNPYSLGRMVVRTLAEAVKEVFQARQQVSRDIVPRMHRGGSYPFLRAATNVALRDLNLALVSEQMLRGTPTIYVDFLDYDEIAHHSGPERTEAIHALEGIDRALGRLERLIEDCPRPYRIVVVSDHGQSQGATFRQRFGETIEEWMRTRMAAPVTVEATAPTEQWGQMSAVLTEVSASDGAMPRMARRALKDQTRDGIVELGPMKEERAAETDALPDLVLCASGNLALVYFGIGEGRLSREEIDAGYPGLIDDLVAHPGVGLVLVRTGCGRVRRPRQGRQLPAQRRAGHRRGPARAVRRARADPLPPARRDRPCRRPRPHQHARPRHRRGGGLRGAHRLTRRPRRLADAGVAGVPGVMERARWAAVRRAGGAPAAEGLDRRRAGLGSEGVGARARRPVQASRPWMRIQAPTSPTMMAPTTPSSIRSMAGCARCARASNRSRQKT